MVIDCFVLIFLLMYVKRGYKKGFSTVVSIKKTNIAELLFILFCSMKLNVNTLFINNFIENVAKFIQVELQKIDVLIELQTVVAILNVIINFILIFVVFKLLLFIILKIFAVLKNNPIFLIIDSVGGMIFNFFKGVVICSVMLIVSGKLFTYFNYDINSYLLSLNIFEYLL